MLVVAEQLVEDPVDSRPVQGQTPIDDDVLSGDEPGQVGAQEHDHIGNVIGFPDAAQGVLLVKRSRWWGRNCNNGSVNAVSIIPGEIEFTRICGPYSRAADAVSAATPALAAA